MSVCAGEKLTASLSFLLLIKYACRIICKEGSGEYAAQAV